VTRQRHGARKRDGSEAAGTPSTAAGRARNHYLFGSHPREADRLDLLHFSLREAIGVNHVAPLEHPSRIFDSCSGSGQWCADLAEAFPEAMVVGLDLQAPKVVGGDGLIFLRGNVLTGLPFADGAFDFTHQRLTVAAIPMHGCVPLVEELVRVTRPGGWVELAESPMWLSNTGEATDRLLELIAALAERAGLDNSDVLFRLLEGFLEQAGLTDVSRRAFTVPIGDWGGRAGSLMASNYRTGWLRLADRFASEFHQPLRQMHELIERFGEECEEHETVFNLAVAVGRKPG
jgi:SAM-dependent methyltransferase